MKPNRYLTLLPFVCLMSSTASFSSAQTDNMFRNGDFEATFDAHLIHGVITDEEARPDSSYSLIAGQSGMNQWYEVWEQVIGHDMDEFIPGETYTMTFWAKSTQSTTVKFGFNGDFLVRDIPGNSDWNEYTVTSVVPLPNLRRAFEIRTANVSWDGKIYIDDVVIVKGSTAPTDFVYHPNDRMDSAGGVVFPDGSIQSTAIDYSTGEINVGALNASNDSVQIQSASGQTIGGTNTSNGWLKIEGSGGQILSLDPNEFMFGQEGYIGVANANDLNFTLDGIDRMTIKPSGRVGIGIINPAYALDVAGIVGADGLILEGSGTIAGTTPGTRNLDNAWLKVGDDLGIDPNEIYFRNTGIIGTFPDGGGNHDLRFAPEGVVSMSLNANGRVGIGTQSPSYDLDVNGIIRTNTQLIANAGNTGSITDPWTQETDFTKPISMNSFGLFTRYTGSYYQTIYSGGWTTAYRWARNSSDGVQKMAELFSNDTNQRFDMYKPTTDEVNARLSGSGDSYILDGNFGLGTDSPLTKLHVVGDQKLDGNFITSRYGLPLERFAGAGSHYQYGFFYEHGNPTPSGLRYHYLGYVDDNNGTFRINGQLSGHTQQDGKSIVDVIISARNGLLVRGSVIGDLNKAKIHIYEEAGPDMFDDLHHIYLVTDLWAQVTMDLSVTGGFAKIDVQSPTTVDPDSLPGYELLKVIDGPLLGGISMGQFQ